MSKQTINIGASPNDGTGTPLRTSFDYCNLNFTELYTATGPSGNNIVVPGNATITGDLTVDSSTLKVDSTNDRVGIGTATPLSKLQSVGTVSITDGASTGAANGLHLRFDTGTNTGYISAFHSGVDNRDLIYDAKSHVWQIASGTAMTLNATGRLGIGITPSAWDNPYKCVQLNGGSLSVYPSTDIYLSQNAYNSGGWKRVAAGYASQYIQTNSEHRFLIAETSPTVDSAIAFTTAMTLDASGRLLVGQTTADSGYTLQVSGTATTNSYAARFNGGSSTGNGVYFYLPGTRNTDTTYYLARYGDDSATRFQIFGNGNVQNTNGSYGTISDLRLKENISDARNYLADLLKLRVVKYSLKADASPAANLLGLIAQEVEQVFPTLVETSGDDVKSVKTTVLIPMLLKAIQELTARVQTLEAR